jgi:hypothetical protein
MNFETLQTRWSAQNEKLETSIHLSRALLPESRLNKVSSALQRFLRGIVAELIVNVIVVLLLIVFIGNHLDAAALLAPAAVLFVAVLFQVAFGIYQWVTLRELDISGSILKVQHTLAKLKVQRIQVTKWTFWIAPLLWVPLLIVSFKGVLGVNAYTTFDTLWFLANLLFGVAVIPLMIWVSKRYADRMSRSPRLQRVMDDIAGHDLNAATVFLNDLLQFEKEEGV